MRLDSDPATRVVLLSKEVQELVLGPYRTRLHESRGGKIWADMDSFVRGRYVSICLAPLVTAGRLQMRVADDGVGFDPDEFTIGLGVASMAARVEDSGGAWWISSTPGGGTTVTALVPLPPRKAEAADDLTPP